jgi:hypothetical protein
MRKKLSPPNALDIAVKRAASLESIDAGLDLGKGLELSKYKSIIDTLKGSIDKYNTALSNVDELRNQIKIDLGVVKDWSDRMLSGVSAHYGSDSEEYEKAGGVRKSFIKKVKV